MGAHPQSHAMLVGRKLGLSNECLIKVIATYGLAAAYGHSKHKYSAKILLSNMKDLLLRRSTKISGMLWQEAAVKKLEMVLMSVAYGPCG